MFFCDKPYEMGHKYGNKATKATQLFLVEVLGEDEEEIGHEIGQVEEFAGELEFNSGEIEP